MRSALAMSFLVALLLPALAQAGPVEMAEHYCSTGMPLAGSPVCTCVVQPPTHPLWGWDATNPDAIDISGTCWLLTTALSTSPIPDAIAESELGNLLAAKGEAILWSRSAALNFMIDYHWDRSVIPETVSIVTTDDVDHITEGCDHERSDERGGMHIYDRTTGDLLAILQGGPTSRDVQDVCTHGSREGAPADTLTIVFYDEEVWTSPLPDAPVTDTLLPPGRR